MSLQIDITRRMDRFLLDVAFEAGPGVTALFGPSGAGKTSIASVIAGLSEPDIGQITLRGRKLFDSDAGVNLAAHQRRIGYVFQDGRLFPHMSVIGNIRFGQRFAERAADPDPIIELLGLGALLDRRPGSLSGGEKQRVALARALLSDPEIMLMDEPLAALDGPRKDEILPYLERLRDTSRIPIIYVSHSVAEIARLADRIVILRQGRILRAGPAEDVLSDPAAIPYIGVREAGAILPAVIVEHGADGLSRLKVSGGELLLPGVCGQVGKSLRVRVLAQDILISLEQPKGLSSRNVLAVRIEAIRKGDGPGAAVSLRAGDDRLLARVTAQAVEELELRPGLECFAILKATAVPKGSIGSQYDL